MISISSVHGREVLDSRGFPTLEVELTLTDGSVGRAMVPSGASKGQHEALELRDGDPKRFLGKGVLHAVKNINENIAGLIDGRSFPDLNVLDSKLIEADGTSQKSKLGGNTLLGVSLAAVNAVALSQKRPLYLVLNEMMGLSTNDLKMPVPLMNIINGGMHADNGLEFQEFMIVPHGFSRFSEALRAGAEVFHHLKKKLHSSKFSTAVGDEGGFAPALPSNDRALEVIADAIEAAGYSFGSQISLALDVAASSFFDAKSNRYRVRLKGQEEVESAGLIEYYATLVEKFPIVSIEDGLDENDWAGWTQLTKRLGEKVQLVGDDLFVTQTAFVRRGVETHAANAVLIKVNQVGTMTETFNTMALCRESHFNCIVSHRSGETEDVSIAHLAVGSGCGQIKTGSASRSERMAKYNELLRIEERAAQSGRPLPFAKPF